MANPQNSKRGRIYSPFSNQITVNTLRMGSKDIAVWKNAIDQARNPTTPKRRSLYELFDDIKLDGHLESVMDKRITSITNKKVLFHPTNSDGGVDENVQANILETPWFYQFLKLAMEQIPFGHSLIEMIPEQGLISRVELINRANVIPEFGFVMYSTTNPQEGIYYSGDKADPSFSQYLIEVGGKKDYGKLMTAAQYVIYKRGGFGDWSQFAELFGMPFRVGKYNPYDPNTRTKLAEGLDAMGGAGYAIIPDGTSIEFHEAGNASGQSAIFKDIINMCNAEISKIFVGQTMTTDNGSSRSQSEVHQDVEEAINLSDMLRIEYILNWGFKLKLQQLGYKLDGKFQFENTQVIPLDKQIVIDEKVAQQVPIDSKYWYEKYGVPMGEQKSIKADPPADPPTDPKGQKKKLSSRTLSFGEGRVRSFNDDITQLYAPACDHPEHNLTIVTLSDKKGVDTIWNRIVKGIHSGEISRGHVDEALFKWTANELFTGVTKGFGGSFDQFYHTDPDYKMLAKLETDVHVFSAFKTYQQLRQVTDLLTDKEGNIKPFGQFKKDVEEIGNQFNVNWLNTEYNQAIASSQMASLWVDIEANQEALPFLKYHTAGDGRVRPAHALLSGIVKPVNDEFWNSYYPPNDWGCRCDVIQLATGEETNMKGRKLPTLKPMFDTNTGKRGVVFPEKHPYYKVAKEDKEAAKNNFGMDIPDKNKK